MHIKATSLKTSREKSCCHGWKPPSFEHPSLKCSAARQMLVPKQHRNGENAETNVRKNAKMCLYNLIKTSFEKQQTWSVKKGPKLQENQRSTVFVGYLVRHPDISNCVQCCFGLNHFEPSKSTKPQTGTRFGLNLKITLLWKGKTSEPSTWMTLGSKCIFQGVKSKEIEIIHLGFNDFESINLNEWLRRTTSCLRCSFLADKINLSRKQQTGRWLVNDLVTF